MGSIPVADISAFTINSKGDEASQAAAAKQLADAVKLHGCAGITGHGLPEADLKQAFSTMRRLFDLPLKAKMKAPHPEGLMPHRGYLATAKERSGKLGAVWATDEGEKAFFANAIDWKVLMKEGEGDEMLMENVGDV